MDTFGLDLQAAGIEYEVGDQGFVDFHSLRKTCSTLMAIDNLPQRVRQALMRHSSPELTETTYMDEGRLPVPECLAKMAPLCRDRQSAESVHVGDAPRTDYALPNASP